MSSTQSNPPAAAPAAPVVTNATPPAKPSTSIWHKIAGFFSHVGVTVDSWFEDIFGSTAAHNFAAGAEQLLETSLGQIAMTAVTQANALESNTEKFSTAAKNIASAAAAQGIQVKDSLVNMLIELCVQKLKLTFGPPAS